MNWYLWSRFLISFIGVPISLYIIYTGLMNYIRSRTQYMLYYSFSFAFLMFGIFLYSLTPLLIEGQDYLAEITLGASFFVVMLVIPFYIEYFHGIYKKVPYVSKIFYYAAGGGFASLFFQPWKIIYIDDFYGYAQILSDLLLISMFIQFGCIFIVMFQTFHVVKMNVDLESRDVDRIVKENLSNQDLILPMEDRKTKLNSKKRVLNIIILSFFIGLCIICLGLVLPKWYLDSVGILVVLTPQAYFFSRDKDILLFLSTKKIREETKDLQKKLSVLYQQSGSFPQILESEIQSMVAFIEKADLILPYRNK